MLDNDTLGQFIQANRNRYHEWHPPLMAYAWHWILKVLPNTWGFFLFDNLAFWFGLALLLWTLMPKRPKLAALAVLVIGLNPAMFPINALVWKDAVFGSAMVLVCALLSLWRKNRSKWLVASAFALIFFVSGIRHNGLFAVVPMVGWVLWELSRHNLRTMLAGSFVVALGLSVVHHAISRWLTEGHNGFASQIVLSFDLAGMSVRSRENLYPQYLGLELSDIDKVYLPYTALPLFWTDSRHGMCGGAYRNSVYVLEPGSVPSGKYVGCFSDDYARALPAKLINADATAETCMEAARKHGFPYAGLQFGGECFAGRLLGREKRPESECTMACTAGLRRPGFVRAEFEPEWGRAWMSGILRHPIAFLSHRAEFSIRFLGIGIGPERGSIFFPYNNIPQYPSYLRSDFVTAYSVYWIKKHEHDLEFRAYLYFFPLVLLAFFFWRRLRKYEFESALAASGLLYAFSFFIAGVAVDYRYSFWTAIISCILCARFLYLTAKPLAYYMRRVLPESQRRNIGRSDSRSQPTRD
jgi:hypothetical protein